MAHEEEQYSQRLTAAYDAMRRHAETPAGYTALTHIAGNLLHAAGIMIEDPIPLFALIMHDDLVTAGQEGILNEEAMRSGQAQLVRGVVALTIADALLRKIKPTALDSNPQENLNKMTTAGAEGRVNIDSSLELARTVEENEKRVQREAPELFASVQGFAAKTLKVLGHTQSETLTRAINRTIAQTYVRVLGFGDQPSEMHAPVHPPLPELPARAARRIPVGSR